ncbi:MAG: prenyltransferase/squalene oxidase repeat-containing protein, partial [Planctomycetia bacterium]
MIAVLQKSPAFSVSLSLHCLLLIMLALWVVRETPGPKLRLNLSFGSALTAGPEAGSTPAPAQTEAADEEKMVAIETPAETTETTEPDSDVSPPVTAPAEAEVGPAPAAAAQPAVGALLAGRDAGRRQAMLAGGGGNDATEAAVALALEWLERRQGKDGLWSLQSGYQDGSKQENRLAATAMAVLALQGAGNTTTTGRFKGAVAKAWRALLKAQQQDGSFDVGPLPNLHAMYSHAQATIALCELYGMTRDPDLAEPAARAIGYCVAAQPRHLAALEGEHEPAGHRHVSPLPRLVLPAPGGPLRGHAVT